MDNDRLLLSLCIPTNGRADTVIPLLDSINSQQEDSERFEVVITDNAGNPELEKAVRAMDRPNLRYYKTQAEGFTNQIDAFEKCRGLFCKMLNHRCILLPGSLHALLGIIEDNLAEKPIIYCANGDVKDKREQIECEDLDSFVRQMGIYSSWSAGVSAWREDLDGIRNKPYDSIFPHTVFLFDLRKNSRYLIWNRHYHELQDDAGKGGYNLFEAFGIRFLDLLNRLRLEERISLDTFIKLKRDVFVFLRTMHFKETIMPTDHNYILTDLKKILSVYFSPSDYRKMRLYNYTVAPVALAANKIRKIVTGRKRNNTAAG